MGGVQNRVSLFELNIQCRLRGMRSVLPGTRVSNMVDFERLFWEADEHKSTKIDNVSSLVAAFRGLICVLIFFWGAAFCNPYRCI